MKIVQAPAGYDVYLDGYEDRGPFMVNGALAHALVRLGMEAQRQRSGNIVTNHPVHDAASHDTLVGLAMSIRAQPITPADVQAALEGK